MTIEFTFPSDATHTALANKKAFGGKVFVGTDSSGQVSLGVRFQTKTSDARGAHPISVRASTYPELLALAKNHVLEGFSVSETHSVDPDRWDGFGLILPGTDNGIACSKKCAERASSDGWEYSQVFAVVEHPEFGTLAVTELELLALELPERLDQPS